MAVLNDSIYSLIAEVNELKKLVKCPICLDIVSNPLQISCNHLFCADCINTFINETTSNLKCPVCRKSIKRQRQKPNENIDQIVYFVRTVSEKLKDQFGCDISVLDPTTRIKSNIKSNLAELQLNEETSHDELPQASHKVEKDAFDLLMESSSANLSVKKNKNIKTYSRNRDKQDPNKELYQKLVEFEDNNYRLNIIDWLCDNRNKFDRLTQTQSIIDDDSDVSTYSFNMSSISQEHKMVPYKVKSHSSNRKRTRSLEVKIRQRKYRSRNHSFSGESQKDLENVNIEEIESDKDMFDNEHVNIIHMLEEKCLNTIDSEVMIQDKENRNSDKSKKVRGRKRKKNKDIGGKGTTSGWTRIREINKTIKKGNRELKKLHVSLSSTAKLEKKSLLNVKSRHEDTHTKIEKRNIKPVVLLKRLSSEYEICNKAANCAKAKVYSLEDVESYITHNIHKCVNLEGTNGSSPASSNSDKINEVTVIDVNKQVTNEEKCNNHENVILYPTNKSTEIEKCNLVCTSSQNSGNKKETFHSGSIFSKRVVNEEADDLFTLPTQRIHCESDVDKVERDLIALFSSPKTPEKDNELDLDGKVVQTEQMNKISCMLEELCNTVNMLENTCKNNINVDIMKLSITKLKLMFENLKNTNGMHTVQEEIKQIFNSSTQTTVSDTKSIAIQTEDCDSSGFKISSTADFKTLVQYSVGVQTDVVNGNYLSTTETISDDTKLIAIQTSSVKSKVALTADNTVIQQELACVPTNIEDENPICITSGSSFSSRTSDILVNNDQMADDYYQFTESMDNINFDTQTVLVQNRRSKSTNLITNDKGNDTVQNSTSRAQTQKQAKKKLLFNKEIDRERSIIDCGDSDIDVVENEETIVPIVNDQCISEKSLKAPSNDIVNKEATQDSRISFSLNQENRNTFDDSTMKRFKRVRALMDDGNCGDEFIKKMKLRENPYLMPSISVEFVSQIVENLTEGKGMVQDDTTASMQFSQSLNYDEYLDKIMQRYDKDEVKTSTPKKVYSMQKQTKSQYITNKCNALIKEATSPPKKKLRGEHDEITYEVVKEFDLPFGESESNERNNSQVKRCDSESAFCSNMENVRLAMLEDMPLSNRKSIEFEEELMAESAKSVTKDKSLSEIKVLQNVLLQRENVDEASELRYNLEDEWQKMLEDVEKGSKNSEEVFSDSEDDDVVETTPQKNKSPNNILFMSQSLQRRHPSQVNTALQLPAAEDSPDIIFATDVTSYLNKTFDPPTEFQDYNSANKNCNSLITTENFEATLVPFDVIMTEEDSDLDLTITENVNKNFLIRNNQTSIDKLKDPVAKSVNPLILPTKNIYIKEKQYKQINASSALPAQRDKDLNPIERALKSSYNPLEIIPAKLQSNKIVTSTPKRQESILTFMTNQSKVSQQSTSDLVLPIQQQVKPSIACTRLSKDQVIAISSLVNKKLATYSRSFDSSVTHMIVSVNERNCISDHTMKYVCAVAAGIWVVDFKWIQECISRNSIVQEEPYEALDVSGLPGPKTARLNKSKNLLLQGFNIYLADYFSTITKTALENVIKGLGGKIVPTLEAIKGTPGIRLIITEAKATQDFDIYESWLEALQVVTVDIEWLSRSVGQYRLLSFRPFALCSDDAIGNLGYPEELLLDTPFSFSQSIYTP